MRESYSFAPLGAVGPRPVIHGLRYGLHSFAAGVAKSPELGLHGVLKSLILTQSRSPLAA